MFSGNVLKPHTYKKTPKKYTSDNPIKNEMILITFPSATLKKKIKVKSQFYVRWNALSSAFFHFCTLKDVSFQYVFNSYQNIEIIF